MWRSNLALLVILLLGAGACGRPPREDLLAKGEYLCREARWEEAIPVLKQHLLENPRDAGAHYYLGRCYLNQRSPWPMLAVGELETAMYLFLKSGKVSPIARFNATYFELSCHLEMSKVYLKQIEVLIILNAVDKVLAPWQIEYMRIKHASPAAIYLKRVQSFLTQRMYMATTAEYITRLQRIAAAAKTIVPDSVEVKQLEAIIFGLIRPLRTGPP